MNKQRPKILRQQSRLFPVRPGKDGHGCDTTSLQQKAQNGARHAATIPCDPVKNTSRGEEKDYRSTAPNRFHPPTTAVDRQKESVRKTRHEVAIESCRHLVYSYQRRINRNAGGAWAELQNGMCSSNPTSQSSGRKSNAVMRPSASFSSSSVFVPLRNLQ